MEDARGREKVGGQLLDALPRDAILLTAPAQRASPEADRVKPEGPECPKVRWHCVVGKKAGDDLPQPLPLLGIGWCMRRRSSPLISWSFVRMRSRLVLRLRRKRPWRDLPQMRVKPRKLKVSGLPRPR